MFKNLDKICIINTDHVDENLYYFSDPLTAEYKHSALIIGKNYRNLITTPLNPIPPINHTIVHKKSEMKRTLKKELKGKRVGMNFDFIPYSKYREFKKFCTPIDISSTLKTKRSIKNPQQIERIKIATTKTLAILKNIANRITPAMSERKVATMIETETYNKNLQPSFQPIVATGRNSSVPHHIPGNDKLKGTLLIDMGCKYKNYCSDISRTFFVKHKKTEIKHIQKTYKQVMDIRNRIIKNMKPGIEIKKINKLFTIKQHSLMHGIGLKTHDYPSIPDNTTLKKGMIFSIEPAIYNKNFGIRLEDIVTITRNGCKVFSTPPPTLPVLTQTSSNC